MKALFVNEVSKGNILKVYMDTCVAYHFIVHYEGQYIHMLLEQEYGIQGKFKFSGFGNFEDFETLMERVSSDYRNVEVIPVNTHAYTYIERVVKRILMDDRTNVRSRIKTSEIADHTQMYIKL